MEGGWRVGVVGVDVGWFVRVGEGVIAGVVD